MGCPDHDEERRWRGYENPFSLSWETAGELIEIALELLFALLDALIF